MSKCLNSKSVDGIAHRLADLNAAALENLLCNVIREKLGRFTDTTKTALVEQVDRCMNDREKLLTLTLDLFDKADDATKSLFHANVVSAQACAQLFAEVVKSLEETTTFDKPS